MRGAIFRAPRFVAGLGVSRDYAAIELSERRLFRGSGAGLPLTAGARSVFGAD